MNQNPSNETVSTEMDTFEAATVTASPRRMDVKEYCWSNIEDSPSLSPKKSTVRVEPLNEEIKSHETQPSVLTTDQKETQSSVPTTEQKETQTFIIEKKDEPIVEPVVEPPTTLPVESDSDDDMPPLVSDSDVPSSVSNSEDDMPPLVNDSDGVRRRLTIYTFMHESDDTSDSDTQSEESSEDESVQRRRRRHNEIPPLIIMTFCLLVLVHLVNLVSTYCTTKRC